MSRKVVFIEDLSYEEAKNRIMLFLNTTDKVEFYASDVSEELGIEYFLAAKILDELVKEGRLEMSKDES